jgi:ubiquinone/menaquinone biosynthesis C-methylase UbiE
MIPFRRRDDPFMLVVGMTGVKLGDRVVQIGCAHGGRMAAVAAKVGLSGRAVAVVADDPSAARARKGAAQAGVLVEIETAPPTKLPVESGSFDLAVIDDTAGSFSELRAEERVATVRETLRVLREGGRVMVIGTAARGGLGALFTHAHTAARVDPAPAFEADGFKSVRLLAERDGLTFVEGIKPRTEKGAG